MATDTQVDVALSDRDSAAPVRSKAGASAARAVAAVRRHVVFAVVLSAALVLRGAAIVAYPYAFFMPDSRYYAEYATTYEPGRIRPVGYSAFLAPFLPGSMRPVAVVQHVLVVGLLLAVYVFLTRQGVRRWLAALAVAPFALLGREVALEHLVLAETQFVVLVGAGLMVLAWRPRTSVVLAVTAGAMLAAASLTRSVGLPLLGLGVLYLLVRRQGWRPVLGFLLAAAVPLGGYVVWYHHNHGVYAMTQYSGRFLYGRVQTFADCRKLSLTAEERLLCDDRPVAQRPERPDYYLWNPDSPATLLAGAPSDDPLLSSFASKAIRQQPGDFLIMVARETSWHFRVQPPLSKAFICDIFDVYDLPDEPGRDCRERNYYAVDDPLAVPPEGTLAATPLRVALHSYSVATTSASGPLLGLLVLVILIGVVVRRPRADRQYTWLALMFGATGLGLIVASVATSMYEPRYVVPAMLFLPIGAALAIHRLIAAHQATVHPPSRVAASG